MTRDCISIPVYFNIGPIFNHNVRAYFLLNAQPSDNLHLPPVGVHKTLVQESQVTAVWEWEKTVVICKQPGHLTSMKKDLGPWTKVFNLCCWASEAGFGCNKSWTKTMLDVLYTLVSYSVKKDLKIFQYYDEKLT